jgi:dipeptide/tripeptide permease
MFFKRSSEKRKKKEAERERKRKERKEQQNPAGVQQGLTYMYTVIGLQLLLIFTLMIIMMVIGKVITTPWWVLLAILAVGIGGCIFIYYKVKRSFRKLKETVKDMNLSDRNYEISILGGALSMRVEQNPNRLLEAPKEQSVIEAKTGETQTAGLREQPKIHQVK